MNGKNLENKCRRQLAMFGYVLRKNRARTGENLGGYMIVDADNNIVEGNGVNPFELTLEDVQEWIEEKPFNLNR